MGQRAPDGSTMTPAMVQAKQDQARDVANGLVTPSGEVTTKYGGDGRTVRPDDGHTTSGLDRAMQAHADKMHPRKGK